MSLLPLASPAVACVPAVVADSAVAFNPEVACVLHLLLTLLTKNVPISSIRKLLKSNYVAVILKTTKNTDKSFSFRLY